MSELPQPNPPALSVVIPTMGRPIVVRTVESVLAAAGRISLEVIVAGRIHDDAVRASIESLARRDQRVRHLDVEYATGDSSRKKNAGAEAARAPIVAFLDDDVVVAPDWPARILEAFADPKVGLVSGPSLIPDDINLVGRLAGLALSSRAAGYVAHRYRGGDADPFPVKWSRIIGCNAAYRKSVFVEMGAFDPAFYPGEEMIASHRTQQLGHTLLFLPRAYVYHYPRQTLARFWRQMHGYGATRIRLMRAGVEVEPATLVPMLWVASLIALGALGFFWRFAWTLLGLDVLAYLVVDALIAAEVVASTRRVRDAALLALVPVMHIAYGLAEWREVFAPGRDLGERRQPVGIETSSGGST